MQYPSIPLKCKAGGRKTIVMKINVILEKSFEKWLKTLGYAQGTVLASTRCISDFFFYLETVEITSLEQVTPEIISSYYGYLQTRPNKRQAGALSLNYITANINAIKRFNRYLQQSENYFFEIPVKATPDKQPPRDILSPREIRSMYNACTGDYLGMRDRAILGVFYGCGLRRSEAMMLDITDLMFKEMRLYVRKGKNYRQRRVPITKAIREDLENYTYVAREKILSFKNIKHDALFLSRHVKRMSGNSLINRVQVLATRAKINKPVGLHTLRHSIATHLLQSGLTLEEVSRFLGHSSLESTQIYTHLTCKL